MNEDRSSQDHFYKENNIDINNFKIPNCFYRISVKGLVLDETNRFLITRQGNQKWDLPGGGLDFGENPQEGIKREISEEMGLNTTFIAANPVYFVTTVNPDGIWYSNVIYLCELESLDFTPSWECEEIRFVNPEEALKLNLISNVTELCKQLKSKPL